MDGYYCSGKKTRKKVGGAKKSIGTCFHDDYIKSWWRGGKRGPRKNRCHRGRKKCSNGCRHEDRTRLGPE